MNQSANNPHKNNQTLAENLSWQPLLRGGTSWQTRKMKTVGEHQLVFIPTSGERWLAWVLLVGAVVSLLGLMPYLFSAGKTTLAVFTLLSAPLFGLMGYAMLKSLKKLTFDRQSGRFYHNHASDPVAHAIEQSKPRKPPLIRITEYGHSDAVDSEINEPIKDIVALQIISESIKSTNHAQTMRQFTSQELNVVMQDGSRINVMDHGRKEIFEQDAQTLSEFIDRPIWRQEDHQQAL